MIGSARMLEGLYYFDENSFPNKQVQSSNSSVVSIPACDKIILWYARLRHTSFSYLEHLFSGLFKGVDCDLLHCEDLFLSKSYRISYKIKSYVPSKPFYLIHSDIWGPSKRSTLYGKIWFITFIDDHKRLCWVYLIKNNYEVEQHFKKIYNFVKTQFQTRISILKIDNGIEYFNKCLENFLKEKDIHHQSICKDIPQQNGITECKNHHLLEVARTLMFFMHILKYLWMKLL